jgi:thymidylate synthase (FAD)
MKVTLVDYNYHGESAVIQALSVCRNKQCTEKTIRDVLTASPVPHLAALEFTWFCFKIEGVSRSFTHQLVRHRHFSFMQRSQRACNEADELFVIPETLSKAESDVVNGSLERIRSEYKTLVAIGVPLEDARCVLPNATPTTIFVAGNGRTFWEWFQKRLCSKHTQAEHYAVAKEVYSILRSTFERIPWEKSLPCPNCGMCAK